MLIAFDVGRTLPNTNLSRDFFVVDGSMESWDAHLPSPADFFARVMASKCIVSWQQEKTSINDVRKGECC